MQRRLLTFVFCLMISTGCNQQPQANLPQVPANPVQVNPQQVPVTHKADLFGGRYFLEIETVGSSSLSHHVDHRGQGTEAVVQLAVYEWGGNKLKIDKGTLTFNGNESGLLQPGDRVRVDKNGDLSVNGKQRP